MIPKIFNPEDLKISPEYGYALFYQKISDRAQSIFEQWIQENGKVVLGYEYHVNKESTQWLFRENIMHLPPERMTHQAILICVEPIEKECLEHEPAANVHRFISEGNSVPVFSSEAHCKRCGKKLKATWSVE